MAGRKCRTKRNHAAAKAVYDNIDRKGTKVAEALRANNTVNTTTPVVWEPLLVLPPLLKCENAVCTMPEVCFTVYKSDEEITAIWLSAPCMHFPTAEDVNYQVQELLAEKKLAGQADNALKAMNMTKKEKKLELAALCDLAYDKANLVNALRRYKGKVATAQLKANWETLKPIDKIRGIYKLGLLTQAPQWLADMLSVEMGKTRWYNFLVGGYSPWGCGWTSLGKTIGFEACKWIFGTFIKKVIEGAELQARGARLRI